MNYPYSNNAVMYPRQVRRRPNQAAMMNPIYSRPPLEKIEISPEFMNQVSAEVFKNQALANMLTKNPLCYGMSISDYGASLMRMGKIPKKDFIVSDNKLIEFNRVGERLKETTFYKQSNDSPPLIECDFYNASTQEKYKTIKYSPTETKTCRYTQI